MNARGVLPSATDRVYSGLGASGRRSQVVRGYHGDGQSMNFRVLSSSSHTRIG